MKIQSGVLFDRLFVVLLVYIPMSARSAAKCYTLLAHATEPGRQWAQSQNGICHIASRVVTTEMSNNSPFVIFIDSVTIKLGKHECEFDKNTK